MLFVDCYRSSSPNSNNNERRAVVYKSARAARNILINASSTIDSRWLISEDGISEAAHRKIDANGFCVIATDALKAHLS